MWIVTALSRERIRRPLLIFLITLGAAYPLLAYFIAETPVLLPFTYSLIAAAVAASWRAPRGIVRGSLAALLSYFIAKYLLSFPWLFCPGFCFLIGLLLFPESFRVWKWITVTGMFFVSIWAVTVWQQMFFLQVILPESLLPGVPGLLLGFSLCCSFLIYRLNKDPVQEAYDHYDWTQGSEARLLATQVLEAYQQIRDALQPEQLRNLSEKTVHLCHQLHEILAELRKTDIERLDEQIREIEQRMTSAKDSVAKREYEQALSNKTKQKEQFENLRIQCERIHGQILNYLSALENIRLAYANRHFKNNGENRDVVELFLNIAKMQAETAAENAEVYEKLSAS